MKKNKMKIDPKKKNNMFYMFRAKKNMVQVQLAREIGVAQGTISKAEKGCSDSCYAVLRGLRHRYKINANKYIDQDFKVEP